MKKVGLAAVFLFLVLLSLGASAPTLKEDFSRADFFVELVENTDQCLSDCHAVFKAKNPLNAPLPLGKTLGFRFLGDSKALKSYRVFVQQTMEVEHKRPVYGEKLVWVDTNSGKKQVLKKVVDHYETYYTEKSKWVEATPGFSLAPGETVLVRIEGRKAVSASVDWVPRVDLSLHPTLASKAGSILFERWEWAWWNSDWDKYREIDFTTTVDLNYTNAIELGSLDATDFSGAQSDLDDLRFVWQDTNVLDANFAHWDGTNTDTDYNTILFFHNNGTGFTLSAGTYNSGELKVYYDNDAASESNRTDYQCSYDSFEDGDWTGKPMWTKVVESGSTSDAIVSDANVLKGNYAWKKISTGGYKYYSAPVFGDGNFSITGWLRADNTASYTRIMIMDSGRSTLTSFRFENGFFRCHGTDLSTSPSADTWYKVRIEYTTNGDSNCILFDSSGGLLEAERAVGGSAGTPAGVETHAYGDSGNLVSYFDNVGFAEPRYVSYSLGAEDTEPGVPDANVWRVEGYDFGAALPVFSYVDDGNLVIDFNVFDSDNNRLHADINYSSSNTQGTGTIIVEDVNLVSSMCGGDVDWDDEPSTCSWDWNISGVSDGNYYVNVLLTDQGDTTKNDFAASSARAGIENQEDLNMFFYDENTLVPLQGLTVTVNGGTYETGEDGNVFLNTLEWANGSYTVTASEDNNYGTRYFTASVGGSDQNKHFYMLRDTNGQTIDFKFYDTDQATVLSNATVTAKRFDTNACGQRTTNASGETSLFLNPDTNYVFEITKSGGSTLKYYKTKVTISIPKDESTAAQITPFDVTVKGIGRKEYTSQSSAVEHYIFNNTNDYYQFDFNASGYYSRIMDERLKGNPATHTIQAYLIASTETSTKVVTQDLVDYSPIPYVQVDIFKYLEGEGEILVESVTTDNKGEAFISGVTNEEYSFDVYYEDELVQEADITVTSTQITILFSPPWTTIPEEGAHVTVDFDPSYSKLTAGQSNLQQTVEVENEELSQVLVYATEVNDANRALDVNRYTNTIDASGTSQTNTISIATDLSAWDINHPIQVHVVATLSDGSQTHRKTAYIAYKPTSIYDETLAILREGMGDIIGGGDQPNGMLTMMSVLLTTLACVGVITTTPMRNLGGITIIALIILGFFTWIMWVPLYWYILAALLSITGLIVSWRVV